MAKDLSSLSETDLEHLAEGRFEQMSEAGLTAYNEAPEDVAREEPTGVIAELDKKANALKERGWENLSPSERLGLMAMKFPKQFAKTALGVTEMAPAALARAIPVAIGHRAGEWSRVPGMPQLLGGVGGVVGEAGASLYEGSPITAGNLAGAAAAGAIKPRYSKGVAGAVKEAGRQGVENVAISELESVVDTGELERPSAKAFAAGNAAAVVQGSLDRGKNARRIDVKRADEQQAFETVGKSARAGYPITPREATPTAFERATNAAMRRDVGLPETTKLNHATLEVHLNKLYQPYREAAAISPEAQFSLAGMVEARAESRRLNKAYKASQGNRPDLLDEAEQMDEIASSFENDLLKQTRDAGRHGLAEKIITNRVLAAKTHLAMRALNNSRGVIDAAEYGRVSAKNPKLLTGDAKLIADTYNANQAREFEMGNLLSRPVTIARAVLNATEHSPFGQAFSRNVPSWHRYPDLKAASASLLTKQTGRDEPFKQDAKAASEQVKDFLKKQGR